MNHPSDYLTVAQVALRLDCSQSNVRKLVRTGQLAGWKPGPRVLLIRFDEVDRYEQRRRGPGRPRKTRTE